MLNNFYPLAKSKRIFIEKTSKISLFKPRQNNLEVIKMSKEKDNRPEAFRIKNKALLNQAKRKRCPASDCPGE